MGTLCPTSRLDVMLRLVDGSLQANDHKTRAYTWNHGKIYAHILWLLACSTQPDGSDITSSLEAGQSLVPMGI